MDCALLVGINNYNNRGPIHDLQGCLNDVAGMKDYLTAACGYDPKEIKVLADAQADGAGILSSLNSLVEQMNEAARRGESSRCLFYYAGHGTLIANKDEDGTEWVEAVLCPADFYRGDEHYSPANQLLSADFAKIIDQIDLHLVKFAWLIDACHAGGVPPKAILEDAPTVRAVQPLARVDVILRKTKGYVVRYPDEAAACRFAALAACSETQKALEQRCDDNKKHGVFTYELMRRLVAEHGMGISGVQDVLAHVASLIPGSGQTPAAIGDQLVLAEVLS